MKKKILIKCLVICMINMFMLLHITNIYANEDNVIVDKHSLDNGNVEVILKINDQAKIFGGSFVFEYNNDNLSFDKVMSSKKQNIFLAVNDNYHNEGNKIKISFASSEIIKGDIIAILFENKNKNIEDDDISILQCKVSNEENQIDTFINESTITIEESKGESIIDKEMETIKETNQSENKEEKKEENIKEKTKDGFIQGCKIIIFLISIFIVIILITKRKNRMNQI